MRLAVFSLVLLACAPEPPAPAPAVAFRTPQRLRPPARVLRVVPRHAWDPSPRVGGTPYGADLRAVYDTIVIHHSSFDEAVGPLAIKEYHLQVSGFSDIGYHFVVAPDGTVYEGRPLSRMGAHAGAVNRSDRDPDRGAVGIVLDGNFVAQRPPRAQLRATLLLIDRLRQRLPGIERVIAHREVKGLLPADVSLTSKETECPGDALFGWLDEVRGPALAAKPQPLLELEVIPETPVISAVHADGSEVTPEQG
jgi:hypothetical protein